MSGKVSTAIGVPEGGSDRPRGGLRERTWTRFLRGPDPTVLEDLYVPALAEAVRYDRSCAYFSSAALSAAAQGFGKLIERLEALGDQAPRQVQRASGATQEECWYEPHPEETKMENGILLIRLRRLRESSYEPHPQDEPTQAELDMARVFITDDWLAKTKAEILGLAQFPHNPREDGQRVEYEPGVVGVYLGVADGQEVYAVDPDAMMVKHDAMDFVVAGNHMRWPWIASNRIVVDWSYATLDALHALLHEIIETRLMALGKWSYALAHKIANHYERLWLLSLRPELAALKARAPKE